MALNNYGTIEVNQAHLIVDSNAVLNNNGTIEVNAGTLDCVSGNFATNKGSVFLAPGATFKGNISNGSNGKLHGAGTVMGALVLQSGGGVEAGVSARRRS